MKARALLMANATIQFSNMTLVTGHQWRLKKKSDAADLFIKFLLL
jgi:hypothetical protein